MAAKFSSNIRPFLAASIVDALRIQTPVAWQASTTQSVGSKVTANGNIYVATNNGVTGSVAPSNTSGTSTDGTVTWLYIGTATAPGAVDGNLYLAVGDQVEWPDPNNPPDATAGPDSETAVLANLLTLLKVTSDNCRIGIANYTWTSGTVYSSYDAVTDVNQYPTPLFAVVDNQNVYKCIDNNQGNTSTIKPTGTALGFTVTSDGYVWKYMGSISNIDAINFSTAGYVPVQQILSNDGSAQWSTQQAAQSGSISSFKLYTTNGVAFDTSPTATIIGSGTGAAVTLDLNISNQLRRVIITNGGTGYGVETYVTVKNPTAAGSGAAVATSISSGIVSLGAVTPGSGYTGAAQLLIIGDGTGAAGTVTVAGGVVTLATLSSGGTGYTWAKAFVIAGTAAAVAKAIMAPHNGHGANIITELCANTVIFSMKISSTLAPYVVDGGSFRQVSLVSGVQPYGSSAANATAYVGPIHPNYASPGSLNKYLANSGNLLYINNVAAITHSSSQEELIKVTVSF